MRHYQLSQNLSLDIKPSPSAFKLFVGKTNRLKLVSLSLCGFALDFYLARQWEDPTGDEEQEYVTAEECVAPSTSHVHQSAGCFIG